MQRGSRIGRLALAGVVVVGLFGEVPVAQARPGELVVRIADDFSAYRNLAVQDDGDRFGPWRVVFDGTANGPSVRVRDGVLQLRTPTVRSPARTRAALVVSRARLAADKLHVRATWVTRAQTRVGTPNPWEVGWLVWDYIDDDHFTYLILKPNGWEVGRRDPRFPGGQRFIDDAVEPTTPVGMVRTATVDRIGTRTTVRMDGQVIVEFDVEPGETRGSIGMYCEDSMVDWREISAATGP